MKNRNCGKCNKIVDENKAILKPKKFTKKRRLFLWHQECYEEYLAWAKKSEKTRSEINGRRKYAIGNTFGGMKS